MSRTNRGPVLAIGIDAAEPTLIHELIQLGEMPALEQLTKQGKWIRLDSPAHIGSGAVWPTFMTGTDPSAHGVYGEWCWEPQTMSLTRHTGRALRPFWKILVDADLTVGVLDVPFAPSVGLKRGFEILEWGPHDRLEGGIKITPDAVAEFVTRQVPPHPFSTTRLDVTGPDDYDGLMNLSEACRQGVKLRGELAQALITKHQPDLSLIVFTEIHHAAHLLWHTLTPQDEPPNSEMFSGSRAFDQSLREVYREVDRQVATLIEAAGEEATVVVFSLHGMQPTLGIPAFLPALLREQGFARLAGWDSQSWKQRAISCIAAVKRSAPSGIKRFYYKTLPHKTTSWLAQPTMIPVYDWSRTSAFSLPTDQHGWIRINLAGRESEGLVTLDEYAGVCEQLRDLLLSLATDDGRPIARDVILTAPVAQDALLQTIPDLIVHWDKGAFASNAGIRNSNIRISGEATRLTGQHAFSGFCILKNAHGVHEDSLPVEEMSAKITNLLLSKRAAGSAQ